MELDLTTLTELLCEIKTTLRYILGAIGSLIVIELVKIKNGG